MRMDAPIDVVHSRPFVDAEKAKAGPASSRPATFLEIEITEIAGLLLAWSLLAAVEGSVRVVANANPESGLTPDEGFPPLALLLAGVAEVIFGCGGIGFALAILAFKYRNRKAAVLFLFVQAILGWFVFITFVIAEPAYNSARLAASTIEGVSLSMQRFLITMGILTSAAWCGALQGGQWALVFRLVHMFGGKGETLQRHRLRGTFWSFVVAIGSFATFLTGAILRAELGSSGPIIDAPGFPPNVGVFPGLLISTGLLTMLWGLLGVAAALSGKGNLLGYFHRSWFCIFMSNIVTFALSFGRVPNGILSTPAAQHTVLVFAITFIPVVYTRKIVEWDVYNVCHE